MELPKSNILLPHRSRAATYRNGVIATATSVLLIWASHSAAQSTINYEYDDLNRLKKVTRSGATPAERYQYDDVSNIEWIARGDSPDTDSDQTPNFVDADDDNDGIPDAIEITAGINPLMTADAIGDHDNDGIKNIDEYLQGSDINHFHGDLDSDGNLDLGDILILKRIIFDLEIATQEQEESGHGDVNMDGNLDVGDLVILRRMYFGY